MQVSGERLQDHWSSGCILWNKNFVHMLLYILVGTMSSPNTETLS